MWIVLFDFHFSFFTVVKFFFLGLLTDGEALTLDEEDLNLELALFTTVLNPDVILVADPRIPDFADEHGCIWDSELVTSGQRTDVVTLFGIGGALPL